VLVSCGIAELVGSRRLFPVLRILWKWAFYYTGRFRKGLRGSEGLCLLGNTGDVPYYYYTTVLEMKLMDGKSYLEVSGLGNIGVSCSAEKYYHTTVCTVPVLGYILPPCFSNFGTKLTASYRIFFSHLCTRCDSTVSFSSAYRYSAMEKIRIRAFSVEI